MNTYYVYMLASKKNGTLYIGVTNDLIARVYQHKHFLIDGFTKDYHVHQLVYFEDTSDIQSALAREKQLKNWKREWKIALIEKITLSGKTCIPTSLIMDPGSSPG